MAVKYILKKLERKFSDGRTDTANGKWYARAISVGTLETADLAEIIQRNCSMKKSDVLAVLTELVEVMTDKLQESYAVKLNDFGTFKIGITSKGADDPTNFTVTNNIVGTHVNFQPAYTVDIATGQRTKALLAGVKVSETAKNAVGMESADDTGE